MRVKYLQRSTPGPSLARLQRAITDHYMVDEDSYLEQLLTLVSKRRGDS